MQRHLNRFVYKRLGKRFFDVIFSLTALIIFFPLMVLVGILVKLGSAGPVFFKQTRVGKSFNAFVLVKFRSMVVDAPQKGLSITSAQDPRITLIGRFLRKTKIDELPQLWNVLKGDLSVVGPRPEVEKYVKQFEKDYQQILQVKPGITDFAAIAFRDEESVLNEYDDKEAAYIQHILPKKIEFYHQYLSQISLVMDLKIIMKTMWALW